MNKILKRYGGAVLFACFVGIKIGIYISDQEYDFAITFAIWTISAFIEGWLTQALYINPKLFKLRKDNIELMCDNMALMNLITEESDKNENRRADSAGNGKYERWKNDKN